MSGHRQVDDARVTCNLQPECDMECDEEVLPAQAALITAAVFSSLSLTQLS